MQTICASTFAALIQDAPESGVTFEDCQAYERLTPNTKVSFTCDDGVFTGYTRERCYYSGGTKGRLVVQVYWVHLRTTGAWPVSKLNF